MPSSSIIGFGNSEYEFIKSDFEDIEYKEITVTGASTYVKEKVTVYVNPTTNGKTLIHGHKKLKKKTQLYGSKLRAVSLLSEIAKSRSVQTYFESKRVIDDYGIVYKEVTMNDSTMVLLFEPKEESVSIALKPKDGKVFNYFSSAKDYKGLIERVYNRLNLMGPNEMTTKQKMAIDFRGLGE